MIGAFSSATLWTASTLGILSVFAGFIVFVLALDLRAHRQARPVVLRNAAVWSALWIAAALGFAAYVAWARGWADFTLFLTGYAMEQALSVDNLIAFAAVFAYFHVPLAYRHRALHYGLAGAIVFRLGFVALGAGGLALFGRWVEGGLACVVAWTAWAMARETWRESGTETTVPQDSRWYVKSARALFPVAKNLYGDRFFVRIAGRRMATRLFLALIAIEASDILFSFDSAPAVLAMTRDPVLAYGAMMFAIMGLRSLYAVLEALRRFLTHLDKAVIVILGFVAIKLMLGAVGVLTVSPAISLAIVATPLAAGLAASLIWPVDDKSPAANPT